MRYNKLFSSVFFLMFLFFHLSSMEFVDFDRQEVEGLFVPTNEVGETGASYSDYLLLPDLLNLNLEAFSEKFENFALSRISFHDFSFVQPGRSFYFFFAGLLSVLKGYQDFSVNVETSSLDGSFNSVFSIYKGDKAILKIYIKGVSKAKVLAHNFKREAAFFLRPSDEDNCSSIKILYNKHNILIKSYKKAELTVEAPIFLNFDKFRDFFTVKVKEGKSYLNNLWEHYHSPVPETFRSEKDFHLFLYGIIANTNNLEYLNSNVERGSGRLDIMVKYITENGQLIKYVIELKKSSFRDTLLSDESKIEDAFDQIRSRRYGAATPSITSADKTIASVINLNISNNKITFEEEPLVVPLKAKVRELIFKPAGPVKRPFYSPPVKTSRQN